MKKLAILTAFLAVNYVNDALAQKVELDCRLKMTSIYGQFETVEALSIDMDKGTFESQGFLYDDVTISSAEITALRAIDGGMISWTVSRETLRGEKYKSGGGGVTGVGDCEIVDRQKF